MSQEALDKSFDTAQRFVEQMRDDHRPMAMYTALRAVLDVVEKLKEQIAQRPKPDNTLPTPQPPEAGQLPPHPPIEAVDPVPPTPLPPDPPPTTKPAKH